MEPYVRPGDLARICRPLDWFGLNHYSPIYAAANPNSPLGVALGAGPADVSQTPIGWPIVPEALCETLHQVHNRYRLPIYVTENGLGAHDAPDADGKIDDTSRIEFLSAYIAAVRRAISESVDVRGYFVWSLLDNFEWASGYAVRFGLVHVAYPTQKRTAKASFFWYADLIKAASRVIEPTPSGLGGFNLLR
jgi:beta-glucosidase